MPTLTTIDGAQFTFTVKAVVALTDHDASTGQAVTCVYGITKVVLHINESVVVFLGRLKIAKNFAQLTRPNGSPIWVNAGAVASIRAPLPNEYVAGVNAVVSVGGLTQGVTQTPEAATTLINASGGEL